jgi:hypothetical protein
MYCASCREPGRFPWEHSKGCVDGLKHQLRWYEAGIPIVLLLLVAETALLFWCFMIVARC